MIARIIENAGSLMLVEAIGHRYVVRDIDRGTASFANPNFMNTKMALRGVLNEGETLRDFRKRDALKDNRPLYKTR